jgi:hypothetical protein
MEKAPRGYMGTFNIVHGPVVRRPDTAIHWIVIFPTFVKCLKNCETTDIDDTRIIKNM